MQKVEKNFGAILEEKLKKIDFRIMRKVFGGVDPQQFEDFYLMKEEEFYVKYFGLKLPKFL